MTGHNDDTIGFAEQERTPWLDPIDDYDDRTDGVSPGRLAALVVGGLVAIGLIVGGLWWWQQNGGRPRGELIAAADGDYKMPAEPEKGRFDGEGNVAIAASEGAQTNGRVDPTRLPEQPVIAPPVAVRPAPTPKVTPTRPATTPVRPAAPAAAGTAAATAAVAPAAAPAATGGTMIQLGAFANEAAATRAWDSLKGRFTWMATATRTVTPASVGGRTVYRLRTSAGTAAAARDWCGRLRVAGENCIVLP